MQYTKKFIVPILSLYLSTIIFSPHLFAQSAQEEQPEIPFTFQTGPLAHLLGKDEITVKGQVNILNKTFSLSKKFLEGSAAKQIGPVTISDVEVSVSNIKGVSIVGKATMFDKTAEMGLKHFSSNKVIIGLSFDEENIPSFLIVPKKRVALTGVDLIFEKNVPPKVKTHTVLFGKDVEIDLTQEETGFIVEDVKLSDMFPELKTNETIKDVIFKTLEIKTTARTANTIEVSINGKVNFSSIPMEDIEQDISDLEFSGSISREKGLLFKTVLSKVNLPFIGDVNEAYFQFNIGGQRDIIDEKESYEGYRLVLGGTTQISLPRIGENLDLTLESEYKNGYFAISGKLHKHITIGNVTIENPKIKISRQEVTFFISGRSNIPDFNISVNGELEINYDLDLGKAISQGLPGANYTVKFNGNVEATEPYKPFKDSSISTISSIELLEANVKLEFTSNTGSEEDIKKAISLVGKTNILDQACTAQIKAIETEAGEKGFALKARVNAAWKFSDSFEGLKDTSLEDIELSEVYFIASTLEYNDPALDILLKPGLMLYAGVESSGIIAKAGSLVAGGLEKLAIYGKINREEFALGINIPNVINFAEGPIKSGGLKLEINGPKEISVAFITSIAVNISEEDEVVFSGKIKIKPEKAVAAMTMQGFWNNPFKIKGLSIGDMALQANFDYAAVAAGIPITGIGVTGKIAIGEKDDPDRKNIEMALKMGVDPTENMMKGSMNSLFISDLGKLVNKMGVNIDSSKLPNIGFEDVEVFLAIKPGAIGEISYPAGFTMKGDINFLDWEGKVNISLSESGLIAQGILKEINFHDLLKITGAGPDQERGTEDDGPIIDIALNLMEQHFIISGEVDILGASKRVDVTLDKNGISFETETKLWDLWNGITKVQSEGDIKAPEKWDIKFESTLKDDFKDFFKNQFNAEVEKKIKQSFEKLEAIDSQIEEKRAIVRKSRQPAIDALQQAQDNFSKIDANIKENDAKIANLKTEKKIGWRVAVAALKTANLTQKGYKAAAQKVLEVAEKAVDKTSVDADPRVAKLLVERKALEAITGSTDAITSLSERISTTISNILNTFSIQTALFKGSLKEMKTGVFPLIELDITLNGKEHHISMQFDVKNPTASTKKVLEELLKLK